MKKILSSLRNLNWKQMFYVIAVLLLIITAIQLNRQLAVQFIVLQQFEERQSQLLHEFGQVKEGVIQYGEDLNEMRDYLLLPARDYSFFPETGTEQKKGSNLSLGIYKFVDQTGKGYIISNKQKIASETIKALKNDWKFLDKIRELKLLPAKYLEETDDVIKFKFYQNKTVEIAALVLDKKSGDFYMTSILGTDPIELKDGEEFSQSVLDYFQSNLKNIINTRELINNQKDAIKELWQKEEVSKILSEKKLQVDLDASEINTGFEYSVRNSATDLLLTLLIDRKTGNFILNSKSYSDTAALEPDLIIQLNKLDGETEFEKASKNNEAELKRLLAEPAFKEALEISHLTLADPREDTQKIFYDLKSTNDEKIVGSIIFETLTGNIKFFNAIKNVEQELSDVLSFGVKKND